MSRERRVVITTVSLGPSLCIIGVYVNWATMSLHMIVPLEKAGFATVYKVFIISICLLMMAHETAK